MSRTNFNGSCPHCGEEMTHAETWERGFVVFGSGDYRQCETCGFWENKAYHCEWEGKLIGTDGELNFDNKDGWPCR